jgi:MFS family permease
MEHLGDAYGGRRWEGRDPRRVYAGAALSVLGALAVVLGLLVVTTPLGDLLGLTDLRAAEKAAGTLGGLGIPAMFLGVVAVLPSSRRENVGVTVGAAFCLVGVALFQVAYPDKWTTGAETLAFETSMAYFVGAALAFWFVFTAMASFRTRNNPQGMVRLELTRQGQKKTVQVSREEYKRYADAIRSDGGETEDIIRELESRAED